MDEVSTTLSTLESIDEALTFLQIALEECEKETPQTERISLLIKSFVSHLNHDLSRVERALLLVRNSQDLTSLPDVPPPKFRMFQKARRRDSYGFALEILGMQWDEHEEGVKPGWYYYIGNGSLVHETSLMPFE